MASAGVTAPHAAETSGLREGPLFDDHVPHIGRSIKRLKTPLRHLKESEFVIFGNPGYTWHVLRHKSPAVVSDSVSGVFDGQGNFLPTVS